MSTTPTHPKKRRPGTLISLLQAQGELRTPIFLRLYRQLREAILQGHLQQGERLPGTRPLAQELGVARDHREHVVEVVGHPTREAAERLELAGLAQVLLALPQGLRPRHHALLEIGLGAP